MFVSPVAAARTAKIDQRSALGAAEPYVAVGSRLTLIVIELVAGGSNRHGSRALIHCAVAERGAQ